jgi:hypothetical protein
MGDDGVFTDGLADPPHGQGLAATLASPVARSKEFLPGQQPGGVRIEFLALGVSKFFH